jgi:hypothetical protein
MGTLLLKPCRGASLVLRDQSQPAWQPEVSEEAATVEIYMGSASDLHGTGVLLGTILPGQTLRLDHNPDFDEDKKIYMVPVARDGTRSISQLSDAPSTLLEIRRENVEPTIGQVGGAQTNVVVVGVDGFTRYARFRKVEVADDEAMTTNLQTTVYESADFVNRELPRSIDVTRTGGTSARTVYVRISHSSHAEASVYGPASDVLSVTFANSGGTGGSTGSFDPIPRGEFELMEP